MNTNFGISDSCKVLDVIYGWNHNPIWISGNLYKCKKCGLPMTKETE